MNWRDYLTPEEAVRLDAIPHERDALTAEYKAIYNRARTRMYRSRNK